MRLNAQLRSTFMNAVHASVPAETTPPIRLPALVRRLSEQYVDSLPPVVRDAFREYPGAFRTENFYPFRGTYEGFPVVQGFSYRASVLDEQTKRDVVEYTQWVADDSAYRTRRNRVLSRVDSVVRLSTTVAQLAARLPRFAHLLPELTPAEARAVRDEPPVEIDGLTDLPVESACA